VSRRRRADGPAGSYTFSIVKWARPCSGSDQYGREISQSSFIRADYKTHSNGCGSDTLSLVMMAAASLSSNIAETTAITKLQRVLTVLLTISASAPYARFLAETPITDLPDGARPRAKNISVFPKCKSG